MELRRLERMNELLQRFVSELLLKEFDFGDVLVTISFVETSGNGQDATIGVSVYPFEKSEEVLKTIKKNIFRIQQFINRGLRIRPVPKAIFTIDESQEKGSKVLEKIQEIIE